MKANYFKSVNIILFILTGIISFGQVKQINPPNFNYPSKNRIIQGQLPNLINQLSTSTKEHQKVETINGSFYIDFSEEKKTAETISKNFNTWFNLDENHTFKKINEKTDDLNISHNYYEQYYKGILIEGSLLMLHSKDGFVFAANGQVAEFSKLETEVIVSKEIALNTAKEYVKVEELLNEYTIETLICKIPSKNGFDYKFAHKVRIDSSTPFIQNDIYVDAKTGKIVNVINLTSEIDTPATASTMYSGTRTITTDSYSGGYRLRDNLRKIETYDSTNSTLNFTGSDFSNTTTTWDNSNVILAFVDLSACSTSWWLTPIIDNKPEFYIKVKDASNLTIYNGNNQYLNNFSPPLIFKMNSINLSNTGTYTIELWEYNSVGSDDFGGSFQLNLSSGSHQWSVNGNSGKYNIIAGNPALDAHWGMEKTYDFYKNVFTRTSFNNAGAIIKNYINPPIYQYQEANDPNQASANRTYDVMSYGYGDGIEFKPWVSLDVMGHEFSHLVVKYRGDTTGIGNMNGLSYQGESGALNESFADIFGTCIEFETKPSTANWTIAEDCYILPSFERSMSDPKSNALPINRRQPNTYQSPLSNGYWDSSASPSVHKNSGVQNYWFYLLSQGGSGTNDLGNNYSVTGIGINKARQIAYLNLTTYLGSNAATYQDSFNGSLLAAQALYGNPSTEYTAVRNAWYAVGLGSNPLNSCAGTTNLTASSGTISDGSGTGNYSNNANCKWVIAPPGATQISLNFTSFNVENTYDYVYIYNGIDDTSTPIYTFTGNTIPPTIISSPGVGALCIKFTSDVSNNNSGWTVNYNSSVTTPACSGGTILTSPTGTVSDGSGTNFYTNNQLCYWYIAPPCATSVTYSFSQIDLESNYDYVYVYNDYIISPSTLLNSFSGSNIPSSITSSTGKMLIVFKTDFYNISNFQGFSGNYTSIGASYCSGVTTLNTSDYGQISDGSGANNYCNNSNCSWLIQPPQATSITLNFSAFELEQPSDDGNIVYDAVEVYDGSSSSATLLGRFSGNSIPASVTSSGSSMFIRFYSDVTNAFQGWSANYTSTQNTYCNGTSSTLSAPSGTFTDGSGTNKYANNSNCSWLIQPPSATSITLSFTSFDTELGYDGVIVYDGVNSSAPVLNQFTGTSIPSALTSTGGSMYVVFLSDESLRANGWNASYTSTTITQTVISQVYGGGGNAGSPSFTNDFIELFNRGTVAQSLNGWSVQYAPALLQSWQTISLPNVTLQPGQYYLIKAASQGTTITTPLPQEDFTSTIQLSATSGKVILVSSTTAESIANPTGSQIIDKVAYGTATPLEGTPTGALSINTAAIRNLSGCTDTNNNASDFTVGTPSPRNSSSPINLCSSLSVSQNTLETVTLYPNPTNSKVFFDNSNSNFKEVSIYNYLGQEVTKTSFNSSIQNQEIDMSNLATGIYVLKFNTGESSKLVKVIKQ